MLSVASSFLMLGIKCSKLPQLKALLDSASKQQRKCERMVLGPSSEDLKKWLASFEQFKVLIPKFDGMTGTQMLAMYDDEPLKQLGVYSEVDRKYLVYCFWQQPCNRFDCAFNYAAPSTCTSPGPCQDCRRYIKFHLCFEMYSDVWSYAGGTPLCLAAPSIELQHVLPGDD